MKQTTSRFVSSNASSVESPFLSSKFQEGTSFKPESNLIPQNSRTTLNNQKQILKCGIENKYLNSIFYLSTCEFAKKRNVLYKLYCLNVRDYYSEFIILYEKCLLKVNLQVQKHDKFVFLFEFKTFISEFISIFKEVSQVQIAYFDGLKQDIARRQYALEWNTNEFVEKLQTYKKSQEQFQERAQLHNKELEEIYLKYENLKKDQKDPYLFFNRKQTSKKANELLESLKKEEKTRQALQKDLDEVFENSTQFQNSLIMYRQQLFNNKYKIMKRLTEISKNSRNSLAELLVYLFECVARKSEDFNRLIKKSQNIPAIKRSKKIFNHDDKLAIQSYLVQVTNEYIRTMDEIQNLFRIVAEIFEELRKFTSNQIETKIKILELINTVYDVDENPDNEVSKTLNFYQDFCTKISEISNGINIATNQIAKLKKEAKKLAEITLSLIRNSKISQKGLDMNLNEGNHHSQIQILLQKLNYDYPISLMQSIYKQFQKNLTHLKNDASQKLHMKKRRLTDSMEISQYQDETLVQPKKRICKKEIWLWGKWHNETLFKIDPFKVSSLIQINQFASKNLVEIPEATQNDRFSCTLETKGETTGFLIVTGKYLKFQNLQGNAILLILLEEIEEAKIVVKMFGNIVCINTVSGSIFLKGCIDPHKVIESIEEARTSSGAPITKPPRAVIEITVEELAAMEERRNKILPLLPKVNDFNLVSEVILENITIDHVYELIYSDRQVNIRGKSEPNFFAYSLKKHGASNYQVTKYDSIGPRFFTHEEGVTFLNCPLFSMRIFDYDVKLPPVPFMPKYAHNREECKLFWISHEQFDYLIHNNTSGAPKAETFFIEILHKVQKDSEKNTKISFFWRIFFIQDSFLKSTIQTNASEETKKGINATITDLKKYCQMMSGPSSSQKLGSEEFIEKQEENEREKNGVQERQGLIGQLIGMVKATLNGLIHSKQKNIEEKGQNNQDNNPNQEPSKTTTNLILILLTVVLLLNLVLHMMGGSK